MTSLEAAWEKYAGKLGDDARYWGYKAGWEDRGEEVERLELRASEMLSILELIEHHDYLMLHEFSAGLRSRIRRVIKEAHGG